MFDRELQLALEMSKRLSQDEPTDSQDTGKRDEGVTEVAVNVEGEDWEAMGVGEGKENQAKTKEGMQMWSQLFVYPTVVLSSFSQCTYYQLMEG